MYDLNEAFRSGPSPVGLVLCLGSMSLPMAVLEADEAEVVVLQPDSEGAATLRESLVNHPAARVIEAVPAPVQGPTHWHRFDIRKFSGPVAAEELTTLYPGLRALPPLLVKGMGPGEVFAECSPRKAGVNWLIVESPGGEAELLMALAGTPGFTAFDRIAVRACRPRLFAAQPLRPLSNFADAGLTLIDAWPDEEPDWLWYLAKPSEVCAANERAENLEKELQTLQAERTRERTARMAAQAEAEKRQIDLDSARTRIAELETQKEISEVRQKALDRELAHAEGQARLISGLLRRNDV